MSSDQFLQLADLFPMAGLAETDLTGRFRRVSPRYCELVGRTAEELCRLRMQDITHPDDLPANLTLFEKLGEYGPPYVIEKRYVRPDGSVVWVQNSVTSPERAAGAPQSALAVAIDITERKRAAEALRASEERQAFLLKLSDALRPLAEPFAILREASRILRTHLGAVRVAYAEMSEDGVNCTLLAEDGAEGTVPLRHTYSWADFDPSGLATLSQGRVISREDVRAAGDLTPEQKANMAATGFRAYMIAPLMKSGRLVALFVVHFDSPRKPAPNEILLLEETAERTWAAVERATAEEAARQRAAQFETLFNQSPQGVYLVDADFRIRELNPLARAGFGDIPGGVVGRDFGEVIHVLWEKEYADELVRLFRHTLDTGEPYFAPERSEHRIDRDETECYERRLARIPMPDGRHGVVCYFRDISDRVRAREALARLAAETERERRLYDTILTATPDLVYVFDLDHRFTYANPALLAMWGKTWDESVGKTCLELGYPDWHAALHDREIEQVKATKRPIRGEVPFTGANGRRIYDYIFVPVLGADGEVEAVAGTTRDVTERKQAEVELQSVSERMRGLLENIDEGFLVLDSEWRFVYLNAMAERINGHRREEVLGKNHWDVFPETVGTRVHRELHRVAAEKVKVEFENYYEPWDRWYNIKAYPTAEGGVSFHFRDITEAKRAEDRLRESEERFRQFAEHSRKLFWMTDPVAGRVLYVNHGYRDIWGRTDESLYADPQSFLEGVHPDDRPRLAEAMQQQLAGEATTQEYRVVRPDGSLRWVVDRAFPIRDEAGRVYRVAGIAEDITARKRTEEDMRFLAGASAALASLMDDASTLQKVARLAVPFFADWCAVDMLDADGKLRRVAVAHVDPAKVELAHELHRRYPPDPAAPQGVWNILRRGRSEMVSEITEEMITASVPDAEQLRTIRELGLRSYIGVPVVAHGRVLGAITFIAAESGRLYDANDLAVAEDLAHRAAVAVENAKLYESLKESDRRKDEFLAVLAHELRNPLAPIRNALHIMKLPAATPQAVGRIRDVAERQVSHLTRLVDDLLDVSRIVRGKIELRKERVDLATIVNRAIETARPVIDAERHEFSATIDAAPVWLNVDPVRLAQVVANLLNNAAKYTEKGGHIRLTAGREGGAAVIRVGDTGIGLDRDMLSRIFEMFTQVAPAHARSQGGLGIGLTLVKNLVEMHGGTVTAHSEGQGRGSEFVVRLPLAPQAGRAGGGAEMEHNGLPPAPNARRVLVVDDNTDAAESLAVLLRLSGHDARVANDGFAALRAAQEMRPDLILLDIGMPGMDGYEVARRLRQDAAFRDVKLVALTGWGQEEDRRRSKSAGFDAHYVKPIDPDVLEKLLD
jgi:PAS domain S-box-containing protein